MWILYRHRSTWDSEMGRYQSWWSLYSPTTAFAWGGTSVSRCATTYFGCAIRNLREPSSPTPLEGWGQWLNLTIPRLMEINAAHLKSEGEAQEITKRGLPVGSQRVALRWTNCCSTRSSRDGPASVVCSGYEGKVRESCHHHVDARQLLLINTRQQRQPSLRSFLVIIHQMITFKSFFCPVASSGSRHGSHYLR